MDVIENNSHLSSMWWLQLCGAMGCQSVSEPSPSGLSVSE